MRNALVGWSGVWCSVEIYTHIGYGYLNEGLSTRNSSSTQKYTQNTNTLHRRRLAGSLL